MINKKFFIKSPLNKINKHKLNKKYKNFHFSKLIIQK